MSETLLSTIITCAVTLIGIFVSSSSTRNAIANDLKTNQAVMNSEFENVKREVNERLKVILKQIYELSEA